MNLLTHSDALALQFPSSGHGTGVSGKEAQAAANASPASDVSVQSTSDATHCAVFLHLNGVLKGQPVALLGQTVVSLAHIPFQHWVCPSGQITHS